MSRLARLRPILILAVTGALLLALAAAAIAQQEFNHATEYDPESGDPPPAQHQEYNYVTWPAKTTPDGAGIKGTITLQDYSDNLDELYVRLTHLPPGKVYTVWLTRQEGDLDERVQVARGWSGDRAKKISFTSRSNGVGFMRGCLHGCPLGRWKWVEVRYHPNGNPKDLRTSVVVIRVRLRQD